MQRTVDKKNFVGIVDDEGLESFVEKSKATFPYHIRAIANQHRHAEAYDIWVDAETEAEINSLLKKGKFIEAGKVVKNILIPAMGEMKIGEEFNDCPGREALIKSIKALGLEKHIVFANAPSEHNYWQNEPDTLVFYTKVNTDPEAVMADVAKFVVGAGADEFDHRVIEGQRYYRMWWD